MITIRLDDGRELGVAAVAPHEAMTIAEGCRELSGVRAWWRTAMLVAAIRMIDGVPLPMPSHERHIEGLVGRFSKSQLKIVGQAAEPLPAETVPQLELKGLTPLEVLRIWAVIGALETTPGWVAPAFIAAQVRVLNGEPVAFPTSKSEIKSLVRRLGITGMNEASTFLLAETEAEKAVERDREAAAKN